MSNTTTLANLTSNADELDAHGGTLPEAWHTIRARWTAYLERQPTPVDDLAAAILDGAGPDDLDRLTLAAHGHVQATPQVTAPIRDDLAGHVLAALKDAYRPVAGDNYAAMAAAYTAAGKRYAKAVATIDPDTPAGDLLEASTAVRSSWAEVEPLAAELDTLLERVTVAARLAAAVSGNTPGQIDTPHLLALATTPRQKDDRRAVWAAWEDKDEAPRGGKWTRLARLGTPLAAPTRLEDWHPYRRPEPIGRKPALSGPRARDYITVEWDPELGETFENKRDEMWATIREERKQRAHQHVS